MTQCFIYIAANLRFGIQAPLPPQYDPVLQHAFLQHVLLSPFLRLHACFCRYYRTMMSYRCPDPNGFAPRVNFFSNPDVERWDKPTGTEIEDNARTIDDNMVSLFSTAVL